MIIEFVVGLTLMQASTTPAEFLQRGEQLGAWFAVLKICGSAGYEIDTTPAEAELVAFEGGLRAYGLARVDGARSFDQGMYRELEAFDLTRFQSRSGNSEADIAPLITRVRNRCRDVADALPGSIIHLDRGESGAANAIAGWFDTAQ